MENNKPKIKINKKLSDNITLTDKQNFIKNEIISWFKSKKKDRAYKTIGGVAGSG